MSRADEERIGDILAAASELEAVVGRGWDAFASDPILRRAAERLLEIIGEAANALSDQTRDSFAGVPWSDIRRLRIVVAHHYHRVDLEQVWTVATEDVPALVQRLQTSG